MRLFHVVAALVFLFVLVFAVEAAGADAQKAKKKKGGAVTGQVTDIQRDAGKNTGSITIKTKAKKKNVGAVGEEKKFVVAESTKFEKAPAKQKGQKAAKGQPGTPATFSDVKNGDLVSITANGNTAEKVVISGAKKKKNQ